VADAGALAAGVGAWMLQPDESTGSALARALIASTIGAGAGIIAHKVNSLLDDGRT
jgi:hypothetical protein